MKPGGRRTFRIPSRLDALAPIRAQILQLARDHGFSPDSAEDLVLCVHEAASNAIVHGNRQNEQLTVEITIEEDSHGLRITVLDQGDGFDVEEMVRQAVSTGDEPRGRGVGIIRSLTDEQCWDEEGRRVSFVKYLP